MPRTPKKRADKAGNAEQPGGTNVFSWMENEMVKKLDALAEDQRRSRSAMVAWVVQQFIAVEYPKLVERQKAARQGQ